MVFELIRSHTPRPTRRCGLANPQYAVRGMAAALLPARKSLAINNMEGRHVGLDFYDLLIEGHYTLTLGTGTPRSMSARG